MTTATRTRAGLFAGLTLTELVGLCALLTRVHVRANRAYEDRRQPGAAAIRDEAFDLLVTDVLPRI